MDIAVMSDIHSNHVAFERCLSYALERNIRTFLFLGDYVGELAYPQKTMDILYQMRDKYRCFFVKGNKEDYMLDYRTAGERGWKEKDSTTGCLLYTYRQLREKDMEFFQNLPPVRGLVNFLIPCGHTHIQGKIRHEGRTVLNAGSIGVPLGSGAKAQFLILHGSERGYEEEFISLSYDTQRAIQELSDSGLMQQAPSWCRITRAVLQDGEPPHGAVLERAMALCRQETGSCRWPDIPERYWERAVEEMGL